ncbi:potassium transporter TrkG [Staphylococcus aureus]
MHDIIVQAIVIFLIILGSIGFPVLLEVNSFIGLLILDFHYLLKLRHQHIYSYLLLGMEPFNLFEHNHAFKGLSWHQIVIDLLVLLATTRSAGLQTIDVTTLSDPTNIITGILMFIGSSPSSVGGGIRTTTFAILILFLINFSNNADKTSIKVYNREVHIMDIQRSFAVFTMATILTFLKEC